MDKTSFHNWIPGRFTLLLCLLPMAMLVAPLLGDSAVGRLTFQTFITLLLLGGVHATRLKRKEQLAALALACISVLLRWTGYATEDMTVQVASDILAAIFLGFVTVEIFLYVVHAERVDANVLSAALCVYLLLAVTFALLYTALDRAAPLSFAIPSETVDSINSRSIGRSADFFYYSLVSMTTTGYGDIRPVSQVARSLTLVEILLGQLYLVVMIARLVGSWGKSPTTKE